MGDGGITPNMNSSIQVLQFPLLVTAQSIPDLIADFSVPFALPLTTGDHNDLKSISCETLAKLVKGEFKDIIGSFKVNICQWLH